MKKGCNKRLKYVKGPEEGKDSGAKVKRLRSSYKYIYKQTNTQKSDKNHAQEVNAHNCNLSFFCDPIS